MILVTRLFIPLAALTMLSACSLPLKVTKVDSMADEVKGVRYFLKRPSYVAGLKVDFDKAEFLDYSNTKNCKWEEPSSSECPIDLKNAKGKIERFPVKDDSDPKNKDKDSVKWIKGDQITNIRDIYCVKFQVSEDPKQIKPLPINITLQQTMEGDPILFEAESRTTPPHWFADSESAITLDDNGYLTAIMAGEDDKSLEFIQAVAGLAVSAVGLYATPSNVPDNFNYSSAPLISKLESSSAKNQCLLIGEKYFHDYVTKHIKLTVRKKNLEEKLNETYQKIELQDERANKSRATSAVRGHPNNAHVSVNTDTPEQMKLRFELMSLLRTEITSIDNELQ